MSFLEIEYLWKYFKKKKLCGSFFYIFPMALFRAVFTTSVMFPATEFDMLNMYCPATITITSMAPMSSIISALICAFSSDNMNFHVFLDFQVFIYPDCAQVLTCCVS